MKVYFAKYTLLILLTSCATTKKTIIPNAGTIFEEHIHRDIKPSHRDTKQNTVSSFDAGTTFDETIDAGLSERKKEILNKTSKPAFGCQLGGIGIFIIGVLILTFIIQVIIKRLKEKAKNVGL